MKKIIIGMLVFIFFIFSYPQKDVNAENQSVLDARKSVVRIFKTYLLKNDEIQGFTGTGFCVGKKDIPCTDIVTNKHVAIWEDEDAVGALKSYLHNYYPQDESAYLTIFDKMVDFHIYVVADGQVYEVDYAKNVTLSSTSDLALIHLKNPIQSRKTIALGDSEKVMSTDKVWAIGYPGLADVNDRKLVSGSEKMETQISANIKSGIEDMTTTKGEVSSVNVVVDGVSHIQHTAEISGGNSGGPLITEKGYGVIGINTWMRSKGASKVLYSIDINTIKQFLRQNDISWYEPNPLFSDNQIMIAAVAGGCVLLLIIVFLILKNRKPSPAAEYPYVSPAPHPSDDGSFLRPVISGDMLKEERRRYTADEPIYDTGTRRDEGESLFSIGGDLSGGSSSAAGRGYGSSYKTSSGSSSFETSDEDEKEDSDFTFTSSL